MASASVLSHSSSSNSLYSYSGPVLSERRASTNQLHVSKSSLRRPPIRSMTSAPSGYVSKHGKLHKMQIHRRSDSGSSLLSATSTMNEYTRTSATGRIKPYLRKMSLRDDDAEQGRLDLSRPSAEHDLDGDTEIEAEIVRGLAVRDFGIGPRSVSDELVLPAIRRQSTHRRATSLSSHSSTQSTPLRSTQQGVSALRHISHPTSNPYTPPTAFSNTTFPHSEDEVEESADILTDDIRRTSIERWHSRRAASVSSVPYGMTMHTHSAASLTRLANASQTNLSSRSIESLQSANDNRANYTRRNTAKSFDLGTNTSSRTSIDRAVSFLSRASVSEPEDPAARAANIRALRRAFEEKEAAKERKMEKVEMKRRDTAETRRAKKEDQRRRNSEICEEKPSWRRRSSNNLASEALSFDEKVAGKEYSRHSPVHSLSLPIQGEESGAAAEARVKTEVSKTKAAKSVWVRFRAWSKTRMLSCY